MWVHLINGRSFWFRDARDYDVTDGILVVYALRKRVLATFRMQAVACWFYDNVEVSTYTVTDKLERSEPHEVR